MTIRDVQNATKQSAEASSEITQKLFAEAAAKQGLHQAQAELEVLAAQERARVKGPAIDWYNPKHNRPYLILDSIESNSRRDLQEAPTA